MPLWALDTIHHAAFDNTVKCTSLNDPKWTLKSTPDYTPSLLDVRSEVSLQDTAKYTPSTLISTPSTFSCTPPGILSRMLTIAFDGSLPAWLGVCSQVSSQDDLKHTLEHTLKYTPNCTRWHTRRLFDYTLPSKYTRCSQVHSKYNLKYTPVHALKDAPNCTRKHTPSLIDYTLPSKLSRHFQVHFEYAPQYTSESVLKLTPGHAPKDAFTCTRLHTPSLLDCTLPYQLSISFQPHSWPWSQVHSQLHWMTLRASLTIHTQVSSQDAPKYTPSTFSSTLPGILSKSLLIALDGTLLACLALPSQVHSQESRHSRSHLTICFHVCSHVLNLETCWIEGARHQEAGGGWPIAHGV